MSQKAFYSLLFQPVGKSEADAFYELIKYITLFANLFNFNFTLLFVITGSLCFPLFGPGNIQLFILYFPHANFFFYILTNAFCKEMDVTACCLSRTTIRPLCAHRVSET